MSKTVTTADVKWGSYKEYEGPLHYGLGKFQPTTFPTDGHKLLDVVTQTEGGSPSAVNGYDRCIISLGMLQWCEAKYFLSSKMLGYIADHDESLLNPLQGALNASGAAFKEKSPGKWRFFIGDDEVDSAEEQHQLFFAGSNGIKGQWTDAQEAHAKMWVAAFVNTLNQPKAIDLQVGYTADRMFMFATPDAKKVLFPNGKKLGSSWMGAVQAAFLSYAANLPAVADKHLKKAVASTKHTPWSEGWCLDIMKELCFGPGISIYPHRYDKIRPKIEQHFKVNLPDFSEELEAWQGSIDADHDAPTKGEPDFFTVEGIQEFLLDQGYDLGPWGADGDMGRKTKDAIMTFQRLHGLKDDGVVGPKTRAEMLKVHRALVCE